MRSALVTGGTGFLGSALVRRLLADAVEVTCLVRPGRKSALARLGGVRVVEAPAQDGGVLKRALEDVSADVVFHLAAYGVQPQDRDGDQLVEGNIQLTANLMEAVAGSRLRRFIYIGTCSAYGPAPKGVLIGEDHPLRPQSVYGAAKAATEIYGNALARRLGLPLVTLRLFNVYGPGEAPHRLFPSTIQHLQSGRPAEFTGGEQVRDFLYVDDVTEALLAAADAEHLSPGEAYNVCSGEATSVREAGEMIADAMAQPRSLLQWGKLPYRIDEFMWVVGDNRKFCAATRWRPQVSVAEGIEKMIAALHHQHA